MSGGLAWIKRPPGWQLLHDDPMPCALDPATRDPMLDCLDEHVARLELARRWYALMVTGVTLDTDAARAEAIWQQWGCDVAHSRSIFWLRVNLLYNAIKLVNPGLAPLAKMGLYTDGLSYNPIPPDGVRRSTLPPPDLVHNAKSGVLIELRTLHRTIFYDCWNKVPGWHIAKASRFNIKEGEGETSLNTSLYTQWTIDLPWTLRDEGDIIVTPLRDTAGVAHSVTFRPDYVSTATGTSVTQAQLELLAVNAVNAKRRVYDSALYNDKNELFVRSKNGKVEKLSHVYERVHVGGLTYNEQRAWTSTLILDAKRYHSTKKAWSALYYTQDGISVSYDLGGPDVVSWDNPEATPFKLPHGVGTRVVNDNGAANAQKEVSDIATELAKGGLPVVVPGYDRVDRGDRYRFVTYDFDDDSTATDAAEFKAATELVDLISGTITDIKNSVTGETARGNSSRRDRLSRHLVDHTNSFVDAKNKVDALERARLPGEHQTIERHPAAAAVPKGKVHRKEAVPKGKVHRKEAVPKGKVHRKKTVPKGTARRRGNSGVKVVPDEEVEYWDAFFEPTPSKIGSQVRPQWRPGHIRQA